MQNEIVSGQKYTKNLSMFTSKKNTFLHRHSGELQIRLVSRLNLQRIQSLKQSASDASQLLMHVATSFKIIETLHSTFH